MKLKRMLSQFPLPKLANIIQNWGGRINRSVSKNDLVNHLSAMMLNPVNLEKVFYSLFPDDRNIIGAVLICDGNVDLGKLSQLTGKTGWLYNFSFYSTSLTSRGLLEVRDEGRTTNVIIPEELIEPLKKLLIDPRPVRIADKNTELEEIESLPIIDDMFRICVFSQNLDGIRLTQQGKIFKKVRQQLFEMMGERSEERLVYTLSLMTGCHLLAHDGKNSRLYPHDENVIRTIFSKSREGATLELIKPVSIIFHFDKQFVANMLAILNQKCNEECEEDWIDYREFITDLKKEFFEKKDVKSWLEFDPFNLNRLIYALHLLGILEIKSYIRPGGVNIHSFKISKFGRRLFEVTDGNCGSHIDAHRGDRPFIVSPNFEVNVFAEETDYFTMYRLSKIAQMVRFDTVCTFRLDKQLVLRELTEGSALEEIISFLEQHSKKELPQNVLYSLFDWGSKYGKVIAGSGYIEITDRSLLESIRQMISPYIIRSIDNPVILFHEKDTDAIMSKLKKAEIFPSKWKKESEVVKKENVI